MSCANELARFVERRGGGGREKKKKKKREDVFRDVAECYIQPRAFQFLPHMMRMTIRDLMMSLFSSFSFSCLTFQLRTGNVALSRVKSSVSVSLFSAAAAGPCSAEEMSKNMKRTKS